MYEHRKAPLLTRELFIRRVVLQTSLTFGVIAAALSIGIMGYHVLGHLGWVDSLLNASMILGGMGPVDPLTSTAAKIFASFYALFSGLIFISVAAMLVAPFFHRFIHKFHLEGK